jgi:superfamily II DNA or RNA helicase
MSPPELPSPEELEEMEEGERERLEEILEAITLAGIAEQIHKEIEELHRLALKAKLVEDTEAAAKLFRLKELLHKEGFFDHPEKRLLIFTEFKDTLDYLMARFKTWGFRVGCIHGSMRSGSRDEPGTRLYTEQQFKEGKIQILVATEAAGEGINLQCCNVCLTTISPGTQIALNNAWGESIAMGKKRIALSLILLLRIPSRDVSCNGCLKNYRKSVMPLTMTPCLMSLVKSSLLPI